MNDLPQESSGNPPAAGSEAQGRALAGRSAGRWLPSGSALIALVVGLALTAALALISLSLYNRNERRLLRLHARELGLVLSEALPTTQTPLASAAELANATNGSPLKFKAFLAPYVGPGRQFASVSLWPIRTTHLSPTAVVGAPPVVLSMPGEAQALFGHPQHEGSLVLTGIIGTTRPTVGLEYVTPSRTPRFAVYAENQLPANRRSPLESNSAFADLDYAVYLGRDRSASNVLVTNLASLPVQDPTAVEVVPFGATALTLVVAPKGSLGGVFFRDLPWLIGIAGAILSLAAALLTERLARGRKRAEQLARDLDRIADANRELYREQRGIAQTLQHALLPEKMPQLQGAQVSALYVPASAGVDIGGDWYDVVALEQRRMLVVVGDVSGHGLEAATTMALLRHAVLAYVSQDARPASVLTRLAAFVAGRNVRGYFATVLCALIDLDARTVTVASAGHPAPLLLAGDDGEFVDMQPELVIGGSLDGGTNYHETSAELPPAGTFLAFTDGLVERRGEVIDVGLARLRALAAKQQLPLAELLHKLVQDLGSDRHHDDTAIVGVQWQS